MLDSIGLGHRHEMGYLHTQEQVDHLEMVEGDVVLAQPDLFSPDRLTMADDSNA